jgi:hypothetical protein
LQFHVFKKSALKFISTYQLFAKVFISLLVVCQVWANTVTYCNWLVKSESGITELLISEVNGPGEEDSKKEKDDKLAVHFFDSILNVVNLKTPIFHSDYDITTRHSEVTSPPPESTFFC